PAPEEATQAPSQYPAGRDTRRRNSFPENSLRLHGTRVQFPPPPLHRKLLTGDSLRQQTTQAPAPPGLVRMVSARSESRRCPPATSPPRDAAGRAANAQPIRVG